MAMDRNGDLIMGIRKAFSFYCMLFDIVFLVSAIG